MVVLMDERFVEGVDCDRRFQHTCTRSTQRTHRRFYNDIRYDRSSPGRSPLHRLTAEPLFEQPVKRTRRRGPLNRTFRIPAILAFTRRRTNRSREDFPRTRPTRRPHLPLHIPRPRASSCQLRLVEEDAGLDVRRLLRTAPTSRGGVCPSTRERRRGRTARWSSTPWTWATSAYRWRWSESQGHLPAECRQQMRNLESGRAAHVEVPWTC